jgi:protein SCO1
MRAASRRSVGRAAAVAVALLLAGLLGGCSHSQTWQLLNITGVMPSLKFRLTDDAGHKVDANTYRGKIVLLYFGYTHCPDVCPTTMAKLTQVMHKLGNAARQVRVLFVTVDPKRDTPKVLQSYTHAFGPQFIGLRTNDDELRTLTKRYRVTYSRGKPDKHGNYEVTHSSAIFIFDGKGNVRLMARYDDQASAITHDLKQLINSG